MKKILTLFSTLPLLAVALFFLVFTGACFTPAVMDESTTKSRTFTEEINSFLFTQDGKQLIVVGKEHHYIFAAEEPLKFILTWPEKKRVQATFDDFVIGSSQSVDGSYMLTIDNAQNLPAQTQSTLLAKGFSKDKTAAANRGTVLSYRNSIRGTRYLADKFELPATMKLNQKYTITMHESYVSTSAVVEKILLTPLAVAADGLLILGGILVLPFVAIIP